MLSTKKQYHTTLLNSSTITHTCERTHTHVHTCAHTYAHTYTHMYTHTHAHTFAHHYIIADKLNNMEDLRWKIFAVNET